MDDRYVEVFSKQAAQVTDTTDPDVARMLAEELLGETALTDEEAEAAFEEMAPEDGGGAQQPTW